MDRGKLVVERVQGKSTLTRCFSKYPFKFINPNKVGGDAVWVYTITYGGGIVSGDSIDYDIEVGDDCMAVLTTQSSTKVYKSIGSKCSKQSLEVLLEKGSCGLDQLQHYHAIAMIIILGPKLKLIQDQIQKDVKKLMSQPLFSKGSSKEAKPSFLASCSTFGQKGQGVVVRVASTTTESIYNFLQQQLASMEVLLGAPPYQ
ncbi:urease accessory protein D-like isoform X3 [Andrographis paniculata]|uniref:urease accessory protein D-like isoform X3 n=1 Tax=Andrographis paniculata TaxID=175694 RepID=UPI0021E7E198|nr:urease accessory protein D-like isoform X3 [Andrographis paniculata]